MTNGNTSNSKASDALIGYRKLIALLIGMVGEIIALKVGAEQANEMTSLLTQLAPIALTMGYMAFNAWSKKITAAPAAPAANTSGSLPAPSPAGLPPPIPQGTGVSAAPAPGPSSPLPPYWDVPDLNEAYKQMILANTGADGAINWFHVANEAQGLYENRKLTKYHPDARLPVALKLSDIAIAARRSVFQVVCKIPPPADYTLVGTQSENEVADLVKKAAPGCETLSEAQRFEIVNLGKLYDERRNIESLAGKSIKWDQGYDTAQLLGHFGFMAIG